MTQLEDAINKVKWLTMCAELNLRGGANLHSSTSIQDRFNSLDVTIDCIYKLKREIIKIANIKNGGIKPLPLKTP